MTPELLKAMGVVEKKNRELVSRVKVFAESVRRYRKDARGLEYSFKARCLERLSVLLGLATENCFAGYPVTASLVARGVIETAGLLVLFDSRMAKLSDRPISDKLDAIRKFVFATRKFGDEKRSVHALDCVRALEAQYPEVELLYDILCEAVHPNWLGVSQFKEFQRDSEVENEQDELLTTSVVQSLLLGHKIASMIKTPNV